MTITRRFDAELAKTLTFLEAAVRRDREPAARDLYLVALLIGDNHAVNLHELKAAYTWMTRQGRLEWSREGSQTIVRYRECLN